MKKVCIVMGSDSDLKVMEGTVKKLRAFGVPFDVRVISAHRTPAAAENLAKNAEADGYGVIIAAAGKAAHLGGVLAAYTTLPVIGVPIKSSFMDGMDSLLSMVQMPSGIPVATVAVNGSDNAAILAVQMLALEDASLRDKLHQFKAEMQAKVEAKDAAVRAQFAE
ncbi:MAG: 5-(carboxyamino)imidazole ribonucleotide mutase [Eubacteriales bacterium]|nr:5-(carboxyamino)imidazole ribonucleotide mutase [Eubacteriales bacterium]